MNAYSFLTLFNFLKHLKKSTVLLVNFFNFMKLHFNMYNYPLIQIYGLRVYVYIITKELFLQTNKLKYPKITCLMLYLPAWKIASQWICLKRNHLLHSTQFWWKGKYLENSYLMHLDYQKSYASQSFQIVWSK